MESSLVLMLIMFLSLVCATSKMEKNPPALTIQSPDGDTIDCVHVREQPAFDNPVLQDHDIQDIPVELLELTNATDAKRAWQVWNRNGTRCPDGTIPIRRNTPGATLFERKYWRNVRAGTDPAYTGDQGHEYAIGEVVYLRGIYGAAATMNVWNPFVEHGTNEFSLSQIWLVAGYYDGNDLNTIEAGWMVYPDHYLDDQPRIFIYWTRDTYQKTGCLNLECPGFIQVSNDFAIGSALAPISSYGGSQYDITVFIRKDTDGNWWLIINSSVIGYWPSNLFTHLARGPAKLVQWGGEVINRRSYGQHTTTQMGSGHFAEEGFGKSSFYRNMKVIDYLGYMQPIQEFIISAKTSTCYSIKKEYNDDWGAHFYFGGPGYNTLCP